MVVQLLLLGHTALQQARVMSVNEVVFEDLLTKKDGFEVSF